MRHATSSVLVLALYLLAALASSAQNSAIDPCPVADSALATPTNPRPTAVEIVHQIMRYPHDRLYFGDQAEVLLCGSPQDAAQFFTEISGKEIRMEGRLSSKPTNIPSASDGPSEEDALTHSAFSSSHL
jgi:hypothetical protein